MWVSWTPISSEPSNRDGESDDDTVGRRGSQEHTTDISQDSPVHAPCNTTPTDAMGQPSVGMFVLGMLSQLPGSKSSLNTVATGASVA